MPPDKITCECGRRKTATQPYCKACKSRWVNAGCPDTGPPPPISMADAGRMSAEARRLKRAEEQPRTAETDPEALTRQYNVWAEARQRRQRHPATIAASLAVCVAVRDAEGIRRLLYRYTDRHWSLLITLAHAANPVLAAMIARQAPEPVIRRAARTACDLIPAVADGDRERAGILIRLRAATWGSYAALAIVLAESATGEQLAVRCDAA